MLRIAQQRPYGTRQRWVRADLEHPPFRTSAHIGAIVCLRFFAHLPMTCWPAVLSTLAQLTAGPIIIGLPMRHSSKHWWRALKRRVGVRAKQRPVFGRDAVLGALRAAGLEYRRRLWQSPFTDTALIVAERRSDRRECGEEGSASVLTGGQARGVPPSP
jgi:hypothetical protein